MPSSPIFDSLTAAQTEAVTHVDGALLILAGPGSGKTRVVTHRIANLVSRGVHPQMILALTFTNKAADEMKERVQRLVPEASVWIGTFHRFCSRLLRRHANLVGLDSNYTIHDTSDSKQALKRAIDGLDAPLTLTRYDAIANQISWLKNHLITAEEFVPGRDELSTITASVYPAYQQELLRSNAVDFDDLLLHVAMILRQSAELRAALDESYRYIMVDEYQDTNLAQYAIVRALSNDYPNLAVTGDPDQSIYGWRGANLRNILDFEHDYPDVSIVRLEQNYRSTPNILRAAQALISNNQQRKDKQLFTANPEGCPVQLAVYPSNKEEAEEIVGEMEQQIRSGSRQPGDFAIFYRVNALSRSFEHALRDYGIPFQIVNGVEFYQRREIRDLLAYLQLINNPKNNSAMARIVNVPSRRIGKTTINRLAEAARSMNICMLDAARDCGSIDTLAKAARPRLKTFAQLMDRLSAHATDSLEEIIGLILTETGYRDYLDESDVAEDQDRVANVDELLDAVRDFDDRNSEPDAVAAFLEQAALVNDTDNLTQQSTVTLMTLHSAKGLEFPVVYVVGVEQGLLPHDRAINIPEQEEEERRLLFVGMTRAMQRLQLSRVLVRSRRGGLSRTIPSSFLVELPRSEMEQIDRAGRVLAVAEPMDCDEPTFDVNDLPDDVTSAAADVQPAAADELADRSARLPSLQTASQMVTSQDSSDDQPGEPQVTTDPDAIQIGMTVIHPQYGPGKVAALSGRGRNRTGTIQFAAVGEKRIVLIHSQVRPAR